MVGVVGSRLGVNDIRIYGVSAGTCDKNWCRASGLGAEEYIRPNFIRAPAVK